MQAFASTDKTKSFEFSVLSFEFSPSHPFSLERAGGNSKLRPSTKTPKFAIISRKTRVYNPLP
jgi:hypothetical protein